MERVPLMKKLKTEQSIRTIKQSQYFKQGKFLGSINFHKRNFSRMAQHAIKGIMHSF